MIIYPPSLDPPPPTIIILPLIYPSTVPTLLQWGREEKSSRCEGKGGGGGVGFPHSTLNIPGGIRGFPH